MDINSTKVITGKVRFCYANVFEPTAMNEGETPKYNVCIVIPKDDEATINKIKSAIDAAIEVYKHKLVNSQGKIPTNLKLPLRDGDGERGEDPIFQGCYFLNASSHRKPSIVDKNLEPIMEKDELYSGCYGRASINFYGFNVSSKGIACGLNNLQKLSDGEPLVGGASAADDFGGENAYSDDLM